MHDYILIDVPCGTTIEQAVLELRAWKPEDHDGHKAAINFNDHILYSDTVTVDGAYKLITGKTKAKFDEERRKERENYVRKEREFQEKIPELTKEWIKKGHKILSEDKWELWDKCVPIRLGDLYHGMELGQCLDIVEILKTGDYEKAKQTMENQGHSGLSWGLMKSMVRSFSDVGEDFIKILDERKNVNDRN